MRAETLLSPIRKHPGLASAVAIALVASSLFPSGVPEIVRLVLSWDVLVAVFLIVAWIIVFPRSKREDIKTRAARYDANDLVILLLCISAVIASLAAIVGLIAGIGDLAPQAKDYHLGLAIVTVAFSWFFLHTVLAIHYAHAYYWPKGDAADAHAGGLQFPGSEAPDYFDFLYFAFVMGATAQTSDVAITAKPMRRLAMLHGTLSFAFNTVLLALMVSIAATLLLGYGSSAP